ERELTVVDMKLSPDRLSVGRESSPSRQCALFSGRQLRHSGARTNGRKSLPAQATPQTASGRHACTPSGGLRNFEHFPGGQDWTTRIPDQTVWPPDRPAPSPDCASVQYERA